MALATRSGAHRIDTSLIHVAARPGGPEPRPGPHHERHEREAVCLCRGVGPRRAAARRETRRSGDAGRRLDHDGRAPAVLPGSGPDVPYQGRVRAADRSAHDRRGGRRRSFRPGPHRGATTSSRRRKSPHTRGTMRRCPNCGPSPSGDATASPGAARLTPCFWSRIDRAELSWVVRDCPPLFLVVRCCHHDVEAARSERLRHRAASLYVRL